MKILLLDNYDSFTYNLYHLINEIYDKIKVIVIRNDKFDIKEINKFDKILLSPGPGLPKDAGIMPKLILECININKPLLGICLGHQGIAEAFGGELFNHKIVFHGVKTIINQTENKDLIFKNVPDKFEGGRYHSWSVIRKTLPKELIITAEDKDGTIMAFKHKTKNIRGLQFHPESIMTIDNGHKIIKNWIDELC